MNAQIYFFFSIWSHIGVFICYQNIAAKKKLNLQAYGIHLLNPYKTVVSHLNPTLIVLRKLRLYQKNKKITVCLHVASVRPTKPCSPRSVMIIIIITLITEVLDKQLVSKN